MIVDNTELMPLVASKIAAQEKQITELEVMLEQQLNSGTDRRLIQTTMKKLEKFRKRLGKLRFLLKDLEAGGEWMKVKGYLYPVDIERFIPQLIGSRCDFLILSSATPNLSSSLYPKVSVKHPFPVKNRRVIYKPVARMDYKHRKEGLPLVAREIQRLVEEYQDKKCLVHCHSYELMKGFKQYLGNIAYIQDRKNRDGSLETWRYSNIPVFLSVDMNEGIDLKGHEFYLNILPVVPWPNTKDPLVQAKKKLNPDAVLLEVVTKIQQAAGRTTRGPDDCSKTYLLDSNFGWFIRKYEHLFEDWFMEAYIR